MAIGARILSNNLSGQTANVTFYPSTGGTINLGSKTIPFNNITSSPYGVYEIYVPTYDYTYELTINQSVDGVQSFVFISKMISNNNNGVINLNFNDFTAEVLDLGIDYTGWYINDMYPLTNSGYAYYFENENTCDLWWVVFTDSAGNVIGEYQANTDCEYDYDVMGGKYVTFTDNINGITKYSNGQEVFTITVDPTYQLFDFLTGWDGVTSTDCLVCRIYENTGFTYTNYIVSGETLTQMGDPTLISQYDDYVSSYFSGSFISVIRYDQINNVYIDLKIYDSDATLLQTVNLSGVTTYNNYYNRFYGDNKVVTVFYNYSDVNVEYLIVHYNGNTNTLNTTTHARGSNYESINISCQTNFYPNDGGSESFVINLYKSAGYTNLGQNVTYSDFIYMLSGDTNFRTYVFQDSGSPDKILNPWFLVSNSLNTLCDNGNGIVSTLTLVQSGATYNSFNIPMSGSPYEWGSYSVRNNSAFVVLDDSYTRANMIYVLEDGTLGDIVTGIPLTGSYQLDVTHVADLLQFINYSSVTYHIDGTSNLFQSGGTITGNTIYRYTPNSQFKSDFLTDGPILTVNYTTKESNILTSTGYTDNFILPGDGEFNIEVGSDKFMYVFADTSGFTNINLYDFNYNLLNSIVTEHTSFWGSNACGDRFVAIVNENNQYTCYLISESTITSKSLTDDNNYYTINDFIWWD